MSRLRLKVLSADKAGTLLRANPKPSLFVLAASVVSALGLVATASTGAVFMGLVAAPVSRARQVQMPAITRRPTPAKKSASGSSACRQST